MRVQILVGDLADFNPRPPRGGRQCRVARFTQAQQISIHVLREEDDLFRNARSIAGIFISIHVLREEDDYVCGSFHYFYTLFQSTSSARRTTQKTCSNS